MDSARMPGKSSQLPSLYDLAGYLFVLLLPFSTFWPTSEPAAPNILPIYGSTGLYLTDIAAFLLLLTSAIGIRKARNDSHPNLHFPSWVVFIPLLLIPLLGLMTAAWAIDPGLAFYAAARWVLALGIFFAWQVKGLNTNRLMKVLLIGLAFQAVIGIMQVILKSPLGIPGEMALSIDRPRAAVLWLEGEAWLRAYGLTFHPNVLGGFLTVGLILGLRGITTWSGRIVWWLMAAGLMVSFSRSAWLAAVLVLIPLTIWLYRQKPELRKSLRITVGAVLGAGIISGIALLGPIMSRLDVFSSLSEYTSISARGELMALALQTIRQHPLTGIGAGNFPLLALNANTHDAAHSVHHVALLLASEIGAVGALLWYWLWLAPVLSLGKSLQTIDPIVLVLTTAWLALGLISLWDSYPWSLEAGRLLSVTLLAWINQENKSLSIPNSPRMLVTSL
ncbi:MAG: O-antigen ligase family protein [Bellilinea sp.]